MKNPSDNNAVSVFRIRKRRLPCAATQADGETIVLRGEKAAVYAGEDVTC